MTVSNLLTGSVWVPESNVLNFGHPLSEGVNVVFNQCVSMAGGTKVQLGRLFLLGAPTPDGTTLRIEMSMLAQGDPFCPFVSDCHPFEPQCVTGGQLVLNGSATTCNGVAVEGSTWSQVKGFFH
jgi:hypothetical protein